MCEGFNLREKRERANKLDELRLLRWIGYMQYAVNRDPKKRMLKPEDLYKLNEPKEEKEIKIPTKEEMKQIGECPDSRKLNDESLFDVINKKKNG